MSESLSQGLPFIELGNKIRLYKSNDITFDSLNKDGFNCSKSRKKPDQFVAHGKNILIGIEDKKTRGDMEAAIKQIAENYLEGMPETNYFIARAGEQTKVFYRSARNKIIEIGTTLKGKEVLCFGSKIISGENTAIKKNLSFLASQILAGTQPVNGSYEILPPKAYYNPLVVKQDTIYNLWQKIFVCTGENAHKCLETFVELLLFKGVSDAKLLPTEYSIETLLDTKSKKSLNTYKRVVRSYIKNTLFPIAANQPGVINGFAFTGEETVFKTVLKDLNNLGNIAQKQIDPDFKRRIIEAFLGSGNREGTIKSGKHLTPRIIIQAIWEMSGVEEGKRVVDPACGVGGFVLEGLNYPYEFDPLKYNCFGIDRATEMIIVSKANMILHLLDKFADPTTNVERLARKVNETFYQAENNGTGTLGELEKNNKQNTEFIPLHPADYIFANVPFYVNGVRQIEDSLDDLGFSSYYESCGIGVESRFIKYILGQIKNGNPGLAFVIVTDGILYRHKDKVRDVINKNADVLGIISLPSGVFQNNNWKTSILIFKKKTNKQEYSPVFIYNVNHIGISFDSYRTPTLDNDIPPLKRAWQQRLAGNIDDPNCKLIARDEFDKSIRWIDFFDSWHTVDTAGNISFEEFIENATTVNSDISNILNVSNKKLSDIFALDNYIEVELGDETYFNTHTASFKATVKHARLNPGKYPLYSSQVDKEVENMEDPLHPPILKGNENGKSHNKLISWNIKGDPCKDIRVHETPFYVTENRGLIEITDENIDFNYLLYYLREHLVAAGNFKRADEAHAGKVKRVKVKIPVNDIGEVDLSKQKEIANNYQQIIDLRKTISEKIADLNLLVEKIDVFK